MFVYILPCCRSIPWMTSLESQVDVTLVVNTQNLTLSEQVLRWQLNNHERNNTTRYLNHAQSKQWASNEHHGAKIEIINALDPKYDPYFFKAASAWQSANRLRKPDAIKFVISRTPKECEYGVKGKVIMCNGDYGPSGYVGVEITNTIRDEIVKSRIKLNDHYLSNTDPTYVQYVTCHEMGHSLGLAHLDEDFNNLPLGSCLDYTRDIHDSQMPNEMDYDELVRMYGMYVEPPPQPISSPVDSDLGAVGAPSMFPSAEPTSNPSKSPTFSPTTSPTGSPCCSLDQKVCGRDVTTFKMQPRCDMSKTKCEYECYGFWQTSADQMRIASNSPNCLGTYSTCAPGKSVCCGNAVCHPYTRWCVPATSAPTISPGVRSPYRQRLPQHRGLLSERSTQRSLLSLDWQKIEKDIGYSHQRYGDLVDMSGNSMHFIKRTSGQNPGSQESFKYIDVKFLLVIPPLEGEESP